MRRVHETTACARVPVGEIVGDDVVWPGWQVGSGGVDLSGSLDRYYVFRLRKCLSIALCAGDAVMYMCLCGLRMRRHRCVAPNHERFGIIYRVRR